MFCIVYYILLIVWFTGFILFSVVIYVGGSMCSLGALFIQFSHSMLVFAIPIVTFEQIYRYDDAIWNRLCFSRCFCLSVCLLATLCKNYWSNLHENFTDMYLCTGKSNLNFGSHHDPVFGSPHSRFGPILP